MTEMEVQKAAADAVAVREPGLSALTRAAIERGIPERTRALYTANWQQFTEWCELNNRSALPASAETLAEYTTYLCYQWIPLKDAWRGDAYKGPRGKKPASVDLARAAIRSAHRAAGLEPPSSEGALKVLKGYRAVLAEGRDPRARPRKATAVTSALLLQILPEDDASPMVVRDRAMLLLGYSTGARASELVRLNIEDIHITPDGLEVQVYRSKTRRFDDVAIPREDAPKAVEAVLAWIRLLAGLGRATGALFLRVTKTGKVGRVAQLGDPEGRLTDQVVTQVLRKYGLRVDASGNWSGHGLRRGMATSAARAGASRYSIAQQGGWDPNSSAMTGYIDAASKWTGNALKGAGV